MRNRNGLVLTIVGAVILCVAAAAVLIPRALPKATGGAATLAPAAAETPTPALTVTLPSGTEVTVSPVPEATAAASSAQAATTAAQADAYLVVTVGDTTYEPLPLYEEGEYALRQEATGAKNVIHVTRDSVRMASSTCENQLCVEQGVVSLANKDSRVLGNMIICLPNRVTLELYSRQEMIDMLATAGT